MNQLPPKRIAIFCSGSGSNAQKIMEHFQENEFGKVVLLLANTPKAYALERAKAMNVETFVFSRTDFYQTDLVLEQLRQVQADVLVLAGFLWLVPANLIAAFPQRIINIHPALLPKFGGKGMYGHHVHEAVKVAAETESGMTIHIIDQEYDKGKVLFQAKCAIADTDTPEDIGAKVLRLEHAYFAPTIEAYLKQI